MSEEAPRRTARRSIPTNQAPRLRAAPAPERAPYTARNVLDTLVREEGFYDAPYRDPYGKWTVGYGTLIGDGSDEDFAASPYAGGRSLNEINAFTRTSTPYGAGASISQINNVNTAAEAREIALGMASREAETKLATVRNRDYIGPVFETLPTNLQDLIVSSAYRGGITGSPNTMRMIREGDFLGASTEFLNNDEYRAARQPGAAAPGVAHRMDRLSEALRLYGQEQNSRSGEALARRVGDRLTQ